jgi:AmmeMemoRadiSam system protein A
VSTEQQQGTEATGVAGAPVSEAARDWVLQLAWEALEHTTEGTRLPDIDPDLLPAELRVHGACFVTLRRGGDLRGCMGNLIPREPLWQAIISNAQAAAQRDPRFPALRTEELSNLEVEVSLLKPPRELPFAHPEDLLDKLRPGVDGVILRVDGITGTFLPQVWEALPEPAAFLAHLCRKMGLESEAWRNPGAKVSVYGVETVE